MKLELRNVRGQWISVSSAYYLIRPSKRRGAARQNYLHRAKINLLPNFCTTIFKINGHKPRFAIFGCRAKKLVCGIDFKNSRQKFCSLLFDKPLKTPFTTADKKIYCSFFWNELKRAFYTERDLFLKSMATNRGFAYLASESVFGERRVSNMHQNNLADFDIFTKHFPIIVYRSHTVIIIIGL